MPATWATLGTGIQSLVRPCSCPQEAELYCETVSKCEGSNDSGSTHCGSTGEAPGKGASPEQCSKDTWQLDHTVGGGALLSGGRKQGAGCRPQEGFWERAGRGVRVQLGREQLCCSPGVGYDHCPILQVRRQWPRAMK